MKKKSSFLSLAGKYHLGKGTKIPEFDRQQLYDEDVARDIDIGVYPDLTYKRTKDGKYIFEKKIP